MYWPSPDLSYYGNLLPTIYIVNSLLHLIAVLIYLSWGLFFLIKPVQLNLYLNHWVHISITREMSFTIWCSNFTRKSILNTNLSLNGGWKVKARKRHVHNKEPMNIPLCMSKKWLLQVKPQKSPCDSGKWPRHRRRHHKPGQRKLRSKRRKRENH